MLLCLKTLQFVLEQVETFVAFGVECMRFVFDKVMNLGGLGYKLWAELVPAKINKLKPSGQYYYI